LRRFGEAKLSGLKVGGVGDVMRKGKSWLAILGCGLSLCGPALFNAQPAQAGLFSVSPEKERSLGQDAAREIDTQARVVTGPVADWVQAVGARLAAVSDKQFEYSFKVIDSKEINAFALPGGHIYVFTGIRKVAQTEDELAAILAHEITHAEQRHYAKQYGKASKRGALLSVLTLAVGMPNIAQQAIGLLDFAMTQKYSRTHETEADLLGMQRMQRAGFNPAAMVTLLERLAKEDKDGGTIDNWFGDHPDSGRRIERARNQLTQLRSGAGNAPVAAPIVAPVASPALP
jgi:predicted Zn-dependent protease